MGILKFDTGDQERIATGRYVFMRIASRDDKGVQEALNKGAENSWTLKSFSVDAGKANTYMFVWDRG